MEAIASKLTPYFKSHPEFVTLEKYCLKSKLMTSAIVCRKGDSYHILIKDGTIHAPFDWHAFSLMRACCKTLVTTGNIVLI